MPAITKPVTLRDVARAAWSDDQCPSNVGLEKVETIARLAVFNIGRCAAFNEGEPVVIDLGNGFLMSCTVAPVEAPN